MSYIDIEWDRFPVASKYTTPIQAETAFMAAEGTLLTTNAGEQSVAEWLPETSSYALAVAGKVTTFAPSEAVTTVLKRRAIQVRGHVIPVGGQSGSGVDLDTVLANIDRYLHSDNLRAEVSGAGWLYKTPDFGQLAILRLNAGDRGNLKWSVGPYREGRVG